MDAKNHNDQQLLIALRAFQSNFVDRNQLIEAIKYLKMDSSNNVADYFRDNKILDRETLDLLLALVQKDESRNQGDIAKCISQMSSIDSDLRFEIEDIASTGTLQLLSHANTLRPPTPSTVSIQIDDRSKGNRSSEDRFTIIRPHARGGLGEVYVAFDKELNREVALKEIRGRHAFDAASRNRFVMEAEITGGLEHPGIVPVYGLGTYADGRPFYAMRFIKGDSLAQEATKVHANAPMKPSDFQGLAFRKLMARFIDVCFAIEYAHARGVLHRDLKPGNIMLGRYGETLVVDWGLAKAVGRPKDQDKEYATETSLRPSSSNDSSPTYYGQAVGTPQFMSPEAAMGELERVGVGSDVFGLGATLYYLLTGKPPYPKTDEKNILELVKECRFTHPRSINPSIPIALEAICLKAMQRAIGDRYNHAREIAEEVERWLADEPVQVVSDPWTVRFARFVRKHRNAVLTATVAGTVCLLGSIGFSILMANKNNQLQTALSNAEASDQRSQLQEQLASNRANAVRAMAIRMIDVAERELSKVPGQIPVREAIMSDVYSTFANVYEAQKENPQIAFDFAKVCRVLGNLKRMNRELPEAAKLLDQSLQIQTKLARSDTDAKVYLAETKRDFATLNKIEGKIEQSIQMLQQASSIVEALIAENANNEDAKGVKALIGLESVENFFDLLQFDKALDAATLSETSLLDLINRNKEIPSDYMVALLAVSRRGQALFALGKPEDGNRVYSNGIAMAKQWSTKADSVDFRNAFARLYLFQATDQSKLTPMPDTAKGLVQEAITRMEELTKSFPTPSFRDNLAYAYGTLGVIERKLGNAADATTAFKRSADILEKLVAEASDSDFFESLARTQFEFAKLEQEQQRLEAARNLFTQAVANQQKAVELCPGSLFQQRTLTEYQTELENLPKAP